MFRFLILFRESVPTHPKEVLTRDGVPVRSRATGQIIYTNWVPSQSMQGLIFGEDQMEEFNWIAGQCLGYFSRYNPAPHCAVEQFEEPKPKLEDLRVLAEASRTRINEMAKAVHSTPEAVKAVIEASSELRMKQGGWVEVLVPLKAHEEQTQSQVDNSHEQDPTPSGGDADTSEPVGAVD